MALANHVLACLSSKDLALLQAHLEPVELVFRQSLERPNEQIKYAYFPEDGIVSVVATTQEGLEVEVGIIGRDGMTAQAVIMGTDRSANSTFVQVAGRAQRIDAQALRDVLRRSETLLRALLAGVQSFIMQASHTALANGRSTITERLARWLLMAHDRLDGDGLPLTHEFLAIMLGVRRAGVTMAIQQLEASGLVKTERRLIVVTDRKGLETLAQGIYGIAEAEQARLTGWKSLKKR
jgi:CRP-like cAMP-binding protein